MSDDARELAGAFGRVLARHGGTMNLSALLPERMLIEAGAGKRLRAALASVSETSFTAAVAARTTALAGGMTGGKAGYRLQGNVAVIDVRGVLSKEFSLWGLIFGGQACTEYVLSGLNNALEDEAAKRILFVIDSPGGEVCGIDELAEAIYAARSKKPIIALGADRCMSGGYWLACQAEKFFVTSNASVGSIGVRWDFDSFERMELNAGIDSRTFASTPAKANPPDDSIQQIVDDLAGNFIAAVARGRGIATEAAAVLADALVYVGQRAVSRGLADGVTTLQALIGQMQAEIDTPPAVTLAIEVEPPSEETVLEMGSAQSTATQRAEAVARPGAPKEAMMSDTTPEPAASPAPTIPTPPEPAASAADLAGVNARLEALEAENAALKAKADGTAAAVATVSADRDADRLVAELHGETGGPVRLAAKDERGEQFVRETVTALGYDGAKADLEKRLAVLGKGTGSVLAGTAAGAPAGSGNALPERHRFDHVGPERWAKSDNPALVEYGQQISWISAEEKRGNKFKTAGEAFAAAKVASDRSAA